MKKQVLLFFLTTAITVNLKAQSSDDKHMEWGPDASRGFPSNYLHCALGSVIQGITNGDYSKMFPPDYKHNNVNGDQKSKMFPPGWKHNPGEGQDKSKMFPGDFKHNNIGSSSTKMYPGNFVHNNIEGKDKTKLYPDHWVHNGSRRSRNQSSMMPPPDKKTGVNGDLSYSETQDGYLEDLGSVLDESSDEGLGDNEEGDGAGKSIVNSITTNSNKFQLDVYPNPVANEVSISPIILPDFVSNATFTIIDMEGKVVQLQTISNADISGNTLNLKISELPAGIYIGSLSVNGKNIIKTSKLIKQ